VRIVDGRGEGGSVGHSVTLASATGQESRSAGSSATPSVNAIGEVLGTEEIQMNWSKWVRQVHRWLAIVFTATVIASFVAIAQAEPPMWVLYTPLPPLALMLFSGLYMFVLPYVAKWRDGRRVASEA
jgi:hypothetical protein